MSHPNPEDPDTRPFQPQSYDLSPEFSVPPTRPPAGQWVPGGYPPSAYPPAAPRIPTYPSAPPARRRRKGWIIALSLVAVVLLGCCGAGAVVLAPFLGEYPATVDAPPHLAGLDKVQNAQVDQLGRQLADELKKNTGADNAVAGLYAPNGDRNHLVLVVGVSGLLLSPAKEVDNTFDGMRGNGLAVSTVKAYKAGSLGGTVKCGTGLIDKIEMSVCVWGDHGTLGMALLYDRPVAESVDLFLQIRDEMVKRS